MRIAGKFGDQVGIIIGDRSLKMNPPFIAEQFMNVFKSYNQTIFPMQIVLFLLAIFALYFVFRKNRFSDRIVSGILGLLWLWTGVVYHLIFFTRINNAAYIFAAAVILQGLLFLFAGSLQNRLIFRLHSDAYATTGWIFIFYALLIYPVLGGLMGHIYPYSPTFGAPCPTTIFTFGLLLLTVRTVPKYLLIIPLLWSFVGFSAALNFGFWEDTGLLLAGIVCTTMIFFKDYKGEVQGA